jgi:hypothetical protein
LAELSVDEAQRLARLFLTGQAIDSDIQRLQNALTDDQGAALELLAQMQAALDDSAPAGLNGEQDRSVNGRIEALIAPRIKKRGPFAFILKLFKGKPKAAPEEAAAPSRRRRRGSASAEAPAEAAPSPAPAAEEMIGGSLAETLPGDGMEEMAPIAAPSSAAAPAPEAPAAPASQPVEAKPKRPLPAWLLPSLAVLLVLALLGAGAAWWLKRPKSLKAVPAPVLAVPKPSPSPTPMGRVRRATANASESNDALPAEIPATTPMPAGSWN